MDIKGYFKKIRDLEASLPDRFVVIVSKATADGGRAGVINEVAKFVGCQLVVEDRARFATDEEIRRFRSIEEPAVEAPADSEEPSKQPNRDAKQVTSTKNRS